MNAQKPLWLFALCISLFHQAADAHMTYSNWLIGFTGGYSGQKTETSMSVAYTQANATYKDIPEINQIYDFHSTGGMGGVFVGYQQVCKRWLVGIEGEWDWQDINRNETTVFSDQAALNGDPGFTWTQNIDLHTKNAGILSARFGFVLDTLIDDVKIIPYLRFGGEWIHQTLAVQVVNNPVAYPYSSFHQSERWPLRFLAGAGFEFPFYGTCLSARIEYNYHSRGQSVENAQWIKDSGIINPAFNTDINTQTNTGKVAVVWNFY